jgi:hypothetical protein
MQGNNAKLQRVKIMSRLVSLYDSCTGGEFRGMVKTNFADNYTFIERFKNNILPDEDGYDISFDQEVK